MTPEQRRAYTAQQFRQFQAAQEQVIFKRSRPTANPVSSHHVIPPRAGMIQQQHLCYSGIRVPIPSHPVCPHTFMARAVPPGAPLSGFCPASLGIQHPSPNQLRVPPSAIPATTMISSAMWMVTATTTHEISRAPSMSQVVTHNIRQHFHSRAIFTQAAGGAPAFPAPPPAFPAQPSAVPPNETATRGGPNKNLNARAEAGLSPVGGKSPVQASVPVLTVPTAPEQGLACSDPRSPIQAIEPPSSVAAAATAATASAVAASQSPEQPKAQSPFSDDALLLPDGCELQLLQELFEGPREVPDDPWLCDLRMIDDILGQHAAVPHTSNPKAPGRDPPPSSGEL